MTEPPWTPEEDSLCREMAAQKSSSGVIAESINRTRHAVVGYCNRNDIPLLGPRFGINARVRRRTGPDSVQAPIKPYRKLGNLPMPPPVPLPPKTIPEHSLEAAGPEDCRFILGDARAMTICGHPVRGGSSFCDLHHAICWVGRS
jgi:hypothetical protein